MDSFFYIENNGSLKRPKRKDKVPLLIKRYILEARDIISLTNDEKEVNVVVGLSHEKPLEYLIKNNEILEVYEK